MYQKTEIYVYSISQQISRTTNTLEAEIIRLRNSFLSSKATEYLKNDCHVAIISVTSGKEKYLKGKQ